MLSLTAQWLDADFNVQNAMLHAQECTGSHTATMICQAFDTMLTQWSIKKEQVHVVLRDNARNMSKAMEECGLASLGCMAHTLQLAVNETVLSQRSIQDCVSIGRKIVGHFKHSQLATSHLQNLQKQLGMKEARLQQDVPTRWNSTFYIMQSLMEQKRALAAYAVDFELPAFLTPHQWALIENMVTILSPCEQLTKDISSASATAADVIPSIQALRRLLNRPASTDHGVKTSKSTLLQAVEQRFNHIYTEGLFFLVTILDPRYKDCVFDPGTKRKATEVLKDQVRAAASAGKDSEEEPKEKKTKEDDNNNVFLLTMYDEILQENSSKELNQSQTDQQVIHLFT